MSDRSSRPLWLGPVRDQREFDHARIHKQLLIDTRLDRPAGPAKSIVLAVYLGLAMHAEIATGCSYPAAGTLAGYAGCSDRSVARAIEVLEQVGYIELRPRPGKAPVCVLLPPPELPDDHRLTTTHRAPPAVVHTPDSQSGVGAATPDCESHHPRPRVRAPLTDVRTNENQEREPTTTSAALVDQALLLHATTVVVGENDPTIRSAAAVARSRIALGLFDDDHHALTDLADRCPCSSPQELLDAWRHHLDADRRAQAEAEARRRGCPACDGHGLILDDTLVAHPCPSCTPKGLSRA